MASTKEDIEAWRDKLSTWIEEQKSKDQEPFSISFKEYKSQLKNLLIQGKGMGTDFELAAALNRQDTLVFENLMLNAFNNKIEPENLAKFIVDPRLPIVSK